MEDAVRRLETESRSVPSLMEEGIPEGASDLRAEELRLKFAAAELAAALERVNRAVEALGTAPLASRARQLCDSLESLQEDAAEALGRRVGERIAAEHRWKVRAGIELIDS